MTFPLLSFLGHMVPILDGNSEHVEHAWRKIGLFGEKISDF